VITPEVFTVAIAVLLDVQVPPLTVEAKVVVVPTHIACEPDKVPADGCGVIVNTITSDAEPVPVTVIVKLTEPAVMSDVLGVYVAVTVVPFVKVPVPEVVQAIVPLFATPEVVKVLPEQMTPSTPALDSGVLLSLSKIETVAAPSKIDEFIGSDNVTLMVSIDSTVTSSVIEIVKVWEI